MICAGRADRPFHRRARVPPSRRRERGPGVLPSPIARPAGRGRPPRGDRHAGFRLGRRRERRPRADPGHQRLPREPRAAFGDQRRDPRAAGRSAGLLAGTRTRRTPASSLVPAGGVAYLAAHIARLRAENPATVVVSAGDLTGASPMLSNLYADEPTVLVDEPPRPRPGGGGQPRLRPRPRPSCDACSSPAARSATATRGTFPGASFEYLAANVIDDATGRTVFPPYAIRDLGGGARRLHRRDAPADAQRHEGERREGALASPTKRRRPTRSCPSSSGRASRPSCSSFIRAGCSRSAAPTTAARASPATSGPSSTSSSPAIDVVVSGHTHQAYDCAIGGHLVTSAMSYGRLVTQDRPRDRPHGSSRRRQARAQRPGHARRRP